jgi:hypothetical protein
MTTTQTFLTPLAMDAKTVTLFNQFLKARERQLAGKMAGYDGFDKPIQNKTASDKRQEIIMVFKVFNDFLNGKIPDFDLLNQEGVK